MRNNDVKSRLEIGNEKFRASTDPVVLVRLAENGQAPFVAILTCSDSRVVPEKLFNLSLGDAFVVRTAGNSASDSTVCGSLEYAVGRLNVKALLVLGHTCCGAVRAVLDGYTTECLSSTIRDIERARSRLSGEDANDPDAISEANVRMQLRLLEDNCPAVRQAVRDGKLRLLGAMYDLSNGSVRFL